MVYPLEKLNIIDEAAKVNDAAKVDDAGSIANSGCGTTVLKYEVESNGFASR